MKKIMVVIGTRPEAIKMSPVIKALQESKGLLPIVCLSGQHTDLARNVLKEFNLSVDIDLDIMTEGQDLFDITSNCMLKIRQVLKRYAPDMVLVHGDTTTAMSSALSAHYLKIPVGHVEAGLRTGDKFSPFPEETNRKIIATVADYNFAPTDRAVRNLLDENVSKKSICKTGNTGIDALLWAINNGPDCSHLSYLFKGRTPILMTAHRRENFGTAMKSIFSAVRRFALAGPNFQIIYPVHPNPKVKNLAQEFFSHVDNVSLTAPMGYFELIYLIQKAQFILSDSGGIQEEAPTLKRPVIILRDTTERPEILETKGGILAGSDEELILKLMTKLSDTSSPLYRSMRSGINPFGDGRAAARIVHAIENQATNKGEGIFHDAQVGTPLVLRLDDYREGQASQ